MKAVKKAVILCDKINEWIGSFIVTSAVILFILVIFFKCDYALCF